MIDSVRDAEAARVFPHMLSVLLDVLRNGEPSLKKDSLEYQFRRVLVEIIHRLPPTEAMRPHTNNLMGTMLQVIRHDSEENAVTCIKTIIDIMRTLKALTEEHVREFLRIFQELLGNVPALIAEFLSESSSQIDPNVVFPGIRSFKVLSEAPIAVVMFTQVFKQFTQPLFPEIWQQAVDVCNFPVFMNVSSSFSGGYSRSTCSEESKRRF